MRDELRIIQLINLTHNKFIISVSKCTKRGEEGEIEKKASTKASVNNFSWGDGNARDGN